jgi:polyisoprenoid-binding protein YceI
VADKNVRFKQKGTMKLQSRTLAVCVLTVILPGLLRAADTPAPKEIDAQRSVMMVRVFKSGMFSAFGHEHEISAPIKQGSLNENSRSVELAVDARQMKVMDKDVSEKDRSEIQETLQGPKVLDSGKFPEIHFHSSAVESNGDGRWRVRGDLTLHGQTKPITFEVHGKDGHYQGSAELKQTDFGIQPVSVGGGTVKVKDTVRIEFQIVAKP